MSSLFFPLSMRDDAIIGLAKFVSGLDQGNMSELFNIILKTEDISNPHR